MAEIKKGIFGGVTGKIGNVVGFQWRGRDFLRAKPQKPHQHTSPAQQAQRDKLSLASSFVNKVRETVTLYYPEVLRNNKLITGKEQLISLLMKQGIECIDHTPCIIIDRVLLAIGTLPAATIRGYTHIEGHTFVFSWDTQLLNILAQAEDQLVLLAYQDEREEFYEISNAGERQLGQLHFTLPSAWTIERIHFWSIWVSKQEKRNSTSQYYLFVSTN